MRIYTLFFGIKSTGQKLNCLTTLNVAISRPRGRFWIVDVGLSSKFRYLSAAAENSHRKLLLKPFTTFFKRIYHYKWHF